MIDFDYKNVSKKEYEEWYEDVIDFNPSPFLHQYASFSFALGEDLTRVFFIHGIGTGKTDYIAQLDAYQLYGQTVPFVGVGYQFIGKDEVEDFR